MSQTELNPAQQQAVQATIGPVLIIAGAGSGKTRVLTERMMHLIRQGNAPGSILAVTFTNKAAHEMRDRIHRMLAADPGINRPVSIEGLPFVSTFHSLGVTIIRENASLLGLHRHFTIADRADAKKLIKEAMHQCSIDPKQFDPGMFLNQISRAKGEGIGYLQYRDRTRDFREEMLADVWEKYDILLAKEKMLDFDDLLLRTMQLLESHAAIREAYARRWQFIHIDEYQDTNKVQYRIARALAETHRNLCVVGDIDQNIYSWRGATIENILHFEKDYPEATVITLEQNYRSTKTILAAANAIIERNKLRRKKTLFTHNDHGDKISVIVSYSESDEARAIADIVRDRLSADIPANEIAVLYRANFQSRALEEAFIKKQIPYQLVGVRFFERKEVKDVLSYIRAALNPDSWNDITRIINVPTRGIGKATIAKIAAGERDSLPAGMKTKVAAFFELLGKIGTEIKKSKPSETVKFVIQQSGLEKSLREGDADDEERLLNIRELVSVATQYDHLMPEEGIEALLTNAALASDQDDLVKNEDAVKLMTVHAAKGLEFDTVFIAGLEQDLFPYKHVDEEDQTAAEAEEERRLFYVALTRARKKLFLSHSLIRTMYGAQRIHEPSEFISEIDPSLLDEHHVDKPTGAKAIFIDF